ncbi:MAG: ribonuclease R [Clostridia bacterium]|nr:ribonuclease R [Clostridia bacterium]
MKKRKKIIGTFKANERGFGFVEFDDENEEDVFISPKHLGGALNGDKVEIIILTPKNKDRRSEGKVVKILEREKSEVVGIFQKNRNFGFVVPDDRKFGTDIFISKENCKNAKNNDKVLAKILKYPEKGKNAEGKIKEVLGKANSAGIDMLSLVKEYNLPYEFPVDVLEEARKIPNYIDQKEIDRRIDLRNKENMHIFTIDGEDAKDLDDAIWVGMANNGHFLLDVHIADVSHYVKAGSKLDREAILRGTSIYMLDRVIPMLPVELSNGICSLNAGEDRLTLSCLMEIDSNGKVVASDVYRSVIRVTERMSYTDVNKILNNLDEEVCKKYEKYIDDFKLMEKLAHILKNRRLQAGYLNLDIPESKITLDKDGVAINVEPYKLTFANEIIEQFMLTANESVAEKFYWMEFPFIYRVHEEPDYDKIAETNKFLFNLGMKIKVSRNNIYPKAFSDVLEEIKGTEYEKVISTLILRTLKVARYESKNKGHFGIASKFYCHFTSPIRRYPDLFIHRVINEYGEYERKNELELLHSKAEEYAKISSDREKIATKVERDAEDIKKAEFMQDKIGEVYEGVISSITSFGMFVELESTVEGLIRFENFNSNEYFEYNEELKILIGERTRTTYKIGDKVKIRVIEANKLLRKIAFELVKEEDDSVFAK